MFGQPGQYIMKIIQNLLHPHYKVDKNKSYENMNFGFKVDIPPQAFEKEE